MVTKKEAQPQVQVLALNNGNIVHIGSFDSVEEAREGALAWYSEADKNRGGWTFFALQGEMLSL